jgi:hypothetical protein
VTGNPGAIAEAVWPNGTAVFPTGDGFLVAVVQDPLGFDAFEAEWDELARSAVEPNVFYEPWFMRAAARTYPPFPGLRLAFVFAVAPAVAPGQRVLCGVFPFRTKPASLRFPAPHVALWRHPFSMLGTPLVRKLRTAEAMRAVFAWLKADRTLPRIVVFERIAGDGPVSQALLDFLRRENKPSFFVEAFTRALLRRAVNVETYLKAPSVHKVDREARRLWRRLSERGRPTFERLGRGDDVGPWIAEFLRVEASGWKGRAGSALDSSPSRRDFFDAACRDAHRRGQLIMMRLRLDGTTIATKCTFVSGDGSFSFKIGHEDAYRVYGPGVLLELENIRAFHEQERPAWMDSCAVSDHAMVSRLWPDRRTIVSVAAGTGKAAGDLIVSALPMARWVSRLLRRKKNA